MATVKLTTELEAVNTMLSAIGSVPVTTLVSPTSVDVTLAHNILNETLRAVCASGWAFNTEYRREFTADGGGIINVGDDILECDIDLDASMDVVLRGEELYDRKNNTNVFTVGKVVKCTVVRMLDFTDLPQAARQYVTIRAARIFQERMKGSAEHWRFSREDEVIALSLLKKQDSRTGDYNYVRQTRLGQAIKGRRSVADRIRSR